MAFEHRQWSKGWGWLLGVGRGGTTHRSRFAWWGSLPRRFQSPLSWHASPSWCCVIWWRCLWCRRTPASGWSPISTRPVGLSVCRRYSAGHLGINHNSVKIYNYFKVSLRKKKWTIFIKKPIFYFISKLSNNSWHFALNLNSVFNHYSWILNFVDVVLDSIHKIRKKLSYLREGFV